MRISGLLVGAGFLVACHMGLSITNCSSWVARSTEGSSGRYTSRAHETGFQAVLDSGHAAPVMFTGESNCSTPSNSPMTTTRPQRRVTHRASRHTPDAHIALPAPGVSNTQCGGGDRFVGRRSANSTAKGCGSILPASSWTAHRATIRSGAAGYTGQAEGPSETARDTA